MSKLSQVTLLSFGTLFGGAAGFYVLEAYKIRENVSAQPMPFDPCFVSTDLFQVVPCHHANDFFLSTVLTLYASQERRLGMFLDRKEQNVKA